MKRFVDVLILVVLLGLCSSFVHAHDFVWKVKLQNGEEYPRVALDRLSHDTLYFLHKSNYADWIVVDSIAQLKRERKGAILPATLIGAVGGGAVGFALKPVARDQEEANVYSAAFGVVVGGVAGYFIGSLIQPDEVVELSSLNHESKVQQVQQALK